MISTRGKDTAPMDEAILKGLAKDGGLYVPEHFPKYSIEQFYSLDNFSDFSIRLLAPFFTQSKIAINRNFCDSVFTFPLVITHLSRKKYVLELFHGPTLSFKDFGARFFAQCLQQLTQDKPAKVLVATSGDTGSAVAGALHGKTGIKGFILFPKDKISLRQQIQITCWGDNIHAIAVQGTFDQCQQLVKTAFAKSSEHDQILTTANSINIARLLPQILFYAYSSIQLAKQHNELVNFIVPSGNLGNVTACYWAKKIGFPIDRILIANNKNSVLTEFLKTGIYQKKTSIKTLATAMDVGDPSNLERLRNLFSDFTSFKKQLNVQSVTDEEIKSAIKECYDTYHYVICPHTATAYHRLMKINENQPWVIVSTAHPAKFEQIIEPLLNIKIPIPEQLNHLLTKKQYLELIEPNFKSLNYKLHIK